MCFVSMTPDLDGDRCVVVYIADDRIWGKVIHRRNFRDASRRADLGKVGIVGMNLIA